MKTLSCFFSFLMFLNIGFAQHGVEIIPDQIIIQLEKGTDHQLFINKHLPHYPSLSFKNIISKKLDLYIFEYNQNAPNHENDLEKIKKLPAVKIADFNFRVNQRATTPDDTMYDDQWDMERIDAPEAWDITTGGQTVDNEDIVIAVIEGGDIDHEDVQGNIWINENEIPDDGMDNDDNGYKDDYNGWNVNEENDDPIRDSHSTSVMGIMGAKGNNNMGVTGVNWNTKLMIVSNNLQFDQIIASYDYVFTQRKLYNETNGSKGAFVVATNSSFGVDNVFPEDNSFFPTWCAMYDSLGSVGVLSAGATTNSKHNIDDTGDMPATCSSDYLITVTNTDINDDLLGGFSSTYIDLSAPGKNSFTLKPNNGYGNFGGTSAATPHVAGAIGLLYSMPCEGLIDQAKSQPAETALLIKEVILEGVDKIESLDGKALSEGRLNIFNSLELLQNEFGTTKGSLQISKIYPNPPTNGYVNIEYQTPEFTEYQVRIFNAMGQLFYTETIPEFCASKALNITTKNWPSGIYVISVGNSSDVTTAKISVVSHNQ